MAFVDLTSPVFKQPDTAGGGAHLWSADKQKDQEHDANANDAAVEMSFSLRRWHDDGH